MTTLFPASSAPAPGAGPTYRGLSRTYKLAPCVLTVEDLRRLFNELNERTQEAIERQGSSVVAPPGQDASEFRRRMVEATPLTMMVFGGGGEQVILNAVEAIQPGVLPDLIRVIVYDSAVNFQTQ